MAELYDVDDYGRPLAPEMRYERVYVDGKPIGWRVPDHERPRWESGPALPAEQPRPVDLESRDVDELLDDLRSVVLVGESLERNFREQHKLDPLRVTRLTTYALGAHAAGSLHSPGGFLWVKLLELARET